MRKKIVFFTDTIQSCSRASVNKVDKVLNKKAPEPEEDDNMSLLLNIFDSLNKLYETLNRLDYLIERKGIEKIIYHDDRGEKE